MRVFASGLSRPGNARPFLWAGAPVGAVAGELSPRMIAELAQYAEAGGRVFVDSGAFSTCSRGLAVDSPAILATYRELGRACSCAERIEVVAPDVVGDQAATLELLRMHADDLAELVDVGLTLLVPLQKGSLSGADLLQATRDAVVDLPFVPAVPFNLHAWSDLDVAEFANATRIERVHLLGASGKKLARVAELIDVEVELQGDANRARAWLGTYPTAKLGRVGRKVRRVMAETLDLAIDEYGRDVDGGAWTEDGAEWDALVQDVKDEALWLLALQELGDLALARRLAPTPYLARAGILESPQGPNVARPIGAA